MHPGNPKRHSLQVCGVLPGPTCPEQKELKRPLLIGWCVHRFAWSWPPTPPTHSNIGSSTSSCQFILCSPSGKSWKRAHCRCIADGKMLVGGGWWVVDGGWVGEWAGGWVSGGGRGLSWDMFASCHMPHIIDYYIILLLYIIFWKMSCPPRGFGLETSVLWTRILIDLKKRLPSKKFSHSLWVGICPWFRVFACWNMQTCNVFICASDACPKDVDPLYAELCGRGIRPGIPWWKCLCQVFACWSCCFPSRTPTQNARHRIDDAWAVISKDSWRPSHNSTCDTTGRYWNQCFAWWFYQ